MCNASVCGSRVGEWISVYLHGALSRCVWSLQVICEQEEGAIVYLECAGFRGGWGPRGSHSVFRGAGAAALGTVNSD